MRAWLIALLRWLLVWLESPAGQVVVDVAQELLRARVTALVHQAEQTAAPGTSGAYKKWQMVAPIVAKEFPDVPVKRIHYLIEHVLQETT